MLRSFIGYNQYQVLTTTAEPRRLHKDNHAACGAVILRYHGVFTLLVKLIRAVESSIMAASEEIGMEIGGDSRTGDEKKVQIYLPGQPLKEDEELVCDESAYVMLHEVHAGKKSAPRGFRVQIHE